MTAPLGIAIATFLGGKKKFDAVDRENAKSAMMLSCVYIEEAVIPFLIKAPIRVVGFLYDWWWYYWWIMYGDVTCFTCCSWWNLRYSYGHLIHYYL